jgi:hypothetical protein
MLSAFVIDGESIICNARGRRTVAAGASAAAGISAYQLTADK